MKPSYKYLNIFSPICWAVPLVLIILCFCPGCDKKQLLKIGDNSPEISGNDNHGKFVSLKQFKDKIVVIYFWRNSCCGDKIKLLEAFYGNNKERGLAVLAVNVGDNKEIVDSYANANGWTFTLLSDERAMISEEYGVIGFPTIFILDRNGIVREKILGSVQIEKLQKLVAKQFSIQKETEANYEKTHPR
ncbi:MAG: TlpA disulfide reductase family protein [Desulfuromonadaceae bacterium]|nr:TlpA disulfide reductase family protein [Desulfuromonadaceae bacterium]